MDQEEDRRDNVAYEIVYCNHTRIFTWKADIKNQTAVNTGMADCRNDLGTTRNFVGRWRDIRCTVVSDDRSSFWNVRVGLMIGTELVWNKIKKSGKAIVFTTCTQSLEHFSLYRLSLELYFIFRIFRLYLAFLFGGIALATAPARHCRSCVNLIQKVRLQTH